MADYRICSIDGCGKACFGRGWCSAHYKRWYAHGDPLGGGTYHGDPLAFLKGTVIPFEGDECLIWPFATTPKGYGKMLHNGKYHIVSRIACEAEHGPPPTPEYHAAHNCGKGHEGCVNRKHLEWKLPKENEADKLIHGTHDRGERSANAKLTEAQVLEIRAAQGDRSDIASRFGVSRRTVSNIINRKAWSWLT